MKAQMKRIFFPLWHIINILFSKHYDVLSACRQYGAFHQHLVKVNGRQFAAKYLKDYFANCRRVAFKMKPSHTYKVWSKLDCYGLPSRLHLTNKLVAGSSLLKRRIGLTIAYSYLFLRTPPEISLVTIVKPAKQTPSKKLIKKFDKFLAKEVPRLRYKPKLNAKLRFPFILKTNPYGAISIADAIRDGWTLMQEEYLSYRMAAKDLLRELYPNGRAAEDWEWSVKLSTKFSIFPVWMKKRIAKLSFISDRGGKTRAVVAVNYFLQSALYPLHERVMNLLSRLPQDYTYDQDRGVEVLRKVTRMGLKVSCLDLSAATDRFPISLQARVLAHLISPAASVAWLHLMRMPIYVPQAQGQTVSYAVGQPMGAYSSWPVFALTHHLWIRFLFHKDNVPIGPYSYGVLGDDSFIVNDTVGVSYYKLTQKELGCEISLHKTVLGSVKPCAEFAKRLVIEGNDITPISPGLIFAAKTESVTLVRVLLDRLYTGWKLSTHEFPIDENLLWKLMGGPTSFKAFPYLSTKKVRQRWTAKFNGLMRWLSYPIFASDYAYFDKYANLYWKADKVPDFLVYSDSLQAYITLESARLSIKQNDKVSRITDRVKSWVNLILDESYVCTSIPAHQVRTWLEMAIEWHPLYQVSLDLKNTIQDFSLLAYDPFWAIQNFPKWVNISNNFKWMDSILSRTRRYDMRKEKHKVEAAHSVDLLKDYRKYFGDWIVAKSYVKP